MTRKTSKDKPQQGRPTKEDHLKRDKFHSLGMTESEKERYVTYANLAGMASLSDFLRTAADEYIDNHPVITEQEQDHYMKLAEQKGMTLSAFLQAAVDEYIKAQNT
ncbi:MAG: hypothetical protein EG822_14565 [Deltaproteobacteria bacterium]|nr:hypothetical protein [Deltaproteobacteria bacterium]TLN00267.1 MAG: hypothetical protein FDZ73_19935 [bacterium]